jgi:predicted O-methyltransferase YrrM
LTSDEYFEQFDEKFDLIYVDGDHRYSQQIKDYTNALQVLNRDGILGGHDFNWQSTQKVIVDMGWAESPISIFMDNSFMLLPL